MLVSAIPSFARRHLQRHLRCRLLSTEAALSPKVSIPFSGLVQKGLLVSMTVNLMDSLVT